MASSLFARCEAATAVLRICVADSVKHDAMRRYGVQVKDSKEIKPALERVLNHNAWGRLAVIGVFWSLLKP